MKFIKKSLQRKTLAFIAILLAVVSAISYTFLFHWQTISQLAADVTGKQEILSLPSSIGLETTLTLIVAASIIVAGFIFLYFHFQVFQPLHKIHHEVNALLSGQEYSRLTPGSIDEIGVFTHFFNEITKSLETITGDIKERRRMSDELDIASKIQSEVFPTEAPATKGLSIVAKTRSAAEIGGDSFDFVHSKDNHFIYIGDVTGHGVPAGLVMMMVDTLIDVFAHREDNCKDVLIKTNEFLFPRIDSSLFMTLVMLRWNETEQQMYYSGAGHEHILVYRAETKTVETIRSGGIALGMIPDIHSLVRETPLNLNENDVVLLYSDGITEARRSDGEMFTKNKLIESLKNHGYRNESEEIFDRITQDFADFVGQYQQKDDITLIVAKRTSELTTKRGKLILNLENDDDENESQKWDW